MDMVRIAHPDVEKPASVPARVLGHYEALGWHRVEKPASVAALPPVPRAPEPPADTDQPQTDTPIGDAAQAAAQADTEETP